MSNAPILILQMQRMGDLILTFPLLGWLQRRYPDHPLWVVAESRFFQGLMQLAPKVVFFPPEMADRLAHTTYHSVINLSHRPDAARLSGILRTEHRLGSYTRGGGTYIAGFWQLYRASIVHNNRHNRFHWGDLHLLDTLPPETMPKLGYPEPMAPETTSRGCVGLFVGASEPEKRPEPPFWGALGRALLRKGLRPLFLGGPEDKPLARAAEQAAGITGCNMCGRFSLVQLAHTLRTLDLFVTPDTGPMHLAAWVGTPVLNLSMGNVNAWETGPVASGHHILRTTSSCGGCWQCCRTRPVCREAFHPSRVALVVQTLISHPAQAGRLELPGLALYRTGRDTRGLYVLDTVGQKPTGSRDILGNFWKSWFLAASDPTCHPTDLSETLGRLASANPALPDVLRRTTLKLSMEITRQIRRGGAPFPSDFWKAHPPLLRPLTGYLHLCLQNGEYGAASWQAALDAVAQLAARFEEI